MFSYLKKELGRYIVGVGCGTHIVHNCVQTAVDVLPIEVESLVVKIYKYFYIYTVRDAQLKEFCEFVEIDYKKVLQHGNTPFLSLLPAIERILQIYEGLKSYLCSQEHCPLLLKRFFNSKLGEIYLRFVYGQLGLFNKTILTMEKAKATTTDIVLEINKNLTPCDLEQRKEIFSNINDTQNDINKLIETNPEGASIKSKSGWMESGKKIPRTSIFLISKNGMQKKFITLLLYA